MRLQTYRHEDKRRTLTEWVKDIPIRCVKTIHVKEKIPLGRHYHDNKDEIFYLLKGRGRMFLKSAHKHDALLHKSWVFEGDCIYVQRGTIHVFELLPDSILLEAATESYNEKDEISVEISLPE